MTFTNLKEQFEQIANEEESKNGPLDSSWICVAFPRKEWRKAKAAGAERDGYWGWILWSTSVNSGASEISNRVRSIACEHGLLTRERQL